MIKSMTGYGRGEQVLSGRSITVEIRSVNNRYLDCTVKLPGFMFLRRMQLRQGYRLIFPGGKWMYFLPLDLRKKETCPYPSIARRPMDTTQRSVSCGMLTA